MQNDNQIRLLQKLKSFAEASTSSESRGMLSAGSYPLEQLLKNHPNADTDYAQIVNPDTEELVWICSRWQQNTYAEIINNTENKAAQRNLEPDEMTIEESALTDLIADFLPFTYDLHSPTYPYELLNCNVPLGPPNVNNCCTFVEGLIAKAWQNAKEYAWSNAKHAQMMIFSADDYFSPITCLVDSNIGIKTEDEESTPQPWTVIQGWRNQWSGGHTFIIVDHDPATDRVLTLESNAAFELNGVGYRMIGNIREYPKPPEEWWERENLWTWERIKSTYRFRQSCQLKISNLSWSGLS